MKGFVILLKCGYHAGMDSSMVERANAALECMTLSEDPLLGRFKNAFISIWPIKADDFPAFLRPEFEALADAYCSRELVNAKEAELLVRKLTNFCVIVITEAAIESPSIYRHDE